MNSGHSVSTVRADNGQVGHANLARRPLFHQTDALDAALVSGEAASDFVEQPAVDFVDDLQLPGKENFKPRSRPFLKSFGEQSVIGVGQRVPGKVPGLVPSEVRVIEQDAH